MLRGQSVSSCKPVQGSRVRLCVWSDPQISLVGSDPIGLLWGRISLFGTIGTLLEPGPWAPSVLCAACCHIERDAWESLPTATGIQPVLRHPPTLPGGRLITDVCSQQRSCGSVNGFCVGLVVCLCVLLLQKPGL